MGLFSNLILEKDISNFHVEFHVLCLSRENKNIPQVCGVTGILF